MHSESHSIAPLWDQYRDNFSRHLLGVSRHLQTRLMDSLQSDYGHHGLRLGFAPYITALGRQTLRPSELARKLLVSRQACNQVIRQIERAGYIAHQPDPTDGRATRLILTTQGKALRSDGVKILTQLDTELEQLAGQPRYNRACGALVKLARHIEGNNSPTANEYDGYQGMAGSLPGVAEHTLKRLMELTRKRGHPDLKLSFGQVLTLIGPSGGRIHEIARIQHLSKQAISAIAGELESLGYLHSRSDPLDGRQRVLQFSKRGQRLIEDSVASVTDLGEEFAAVIGDSAFIAMKRTLGEIYHGLQLEQDIFEHRQRPSEIFLLAQQLQQQLGEQGSRALARLLLAKHQA